MSLEGRCDFQTWRCKSQTKPKGSRLISIMIDWHCFRRALMYKLLGEWISLRISWIVYFHWWMVATECAGFVLLLLWILPLLNFPLEVTLGFQSLQGSSNNSHTNTRRDSGTQTQRRSNKLIHTQSTHPQTYTKEHTPMVVSDLHNKLTVDCCQASISLSGRHDVVSWSLILKHCWKKFHLLSPKDPQTPCFSKPKELTGSISLNPLIL